MHYPSLLKTVGRAVALALSVAGVQAQSNTAPALTGFVPARQAAQIKLETEFKTKQSSAAFKNHLEKLSSVPHITGSKENEQVRDYIAETMRRAG